MSDTGPKKYYFNILFACWIVTTIACWCSLYTNFKQADEIAELKLDKIEVAVVKLEKDNLPEK